MSDTRGPTHRHKRIGDVVLLRSTEELGEILTSATGEKFWVKLTDLTQLAVGEPSRKRRHTRTKSQ
jgi:hypothetical protein